MKSLKNCEDMDVIDEFNLEPLSESDWTDLVSLLLCISFQNNYRSLRSQISSFVPNCKDLVNKPSNQTIIFTSFYKDWRINGPFPELRKHDFLSTLEKLISKSMKTNREIFNKMEKSDLIKLFCGIRFLLGKSLLYVPKLVVLDIKTFMRKVYPVLPVTSDNSQAWTSVAEVLNMDLNLNTPTADMKLVSSINGMAVDNLSKKLLSISAERERDSAEIDESFLVIFKNIEPKLTTFMAIIEDLQPKDVCKQVIPDPGPQLQLLIKNISSKSSEEDLLKFWEQMKNIYTETQFWLSDEVTNHIANNCQ